MMSQNDSELRFGYGDNEQLQLLELPYAGERLAMLVLLPRGSSLAAAEAALAPAELEKLRQGLRSEQVRIHLPKFKLSSQVDLIPPLTRLGMGSAFDNADFSRMADTGLFVGEAVHQAYVDVYEEGTEAAAATGIAMWDSARPESGYVFNANRPFVFLILDRQSGLVLFTGRIENPAA
jgi:serpin B